jgi:hypothetical protein
MSEHPQSKSRGLRTKAKKQLKPRTYGEPFILPKSDENVNQRPCRTDERLSENLPDTQKNP